MPLDFTSDDGAAVKLIIVLIVLGFGIVYSFHIIGRVTYLICYGCWFFIHGLFLMIGSMMRIFIVFALLGIAMLCQKYQSTTNQADKTKIRKHLAASFLILWILSASEINYGNPSNVLTKLFFQIMCCLSFIIAFLLNHFRLSTATFKQIKPSRNSGSEIKQCPICMDDIKSGITMKQCQHSICNECGFNYIKHSIIDITKYPIKCFQHECDTKFAIDAIKYIINNQIKQQKSEKLYLQQLLTKYERFSLITSTPKHLRIDCPNADCSNILLKNQPPLDQQFSSKKYPSFTDSANGTSSHYKPLNMVKICESDLCTQSFSMLKWRYNCDICGNVYCHQCVRWKMQILELGYIEPINLCMTCFTNLFCIQCNECKHMICYRCEQPWHNVCDPSDKENGVCKMIKSNDKEALIDAKSKRMMRNNKFQKCPNCGMMIEKTTGCNHMTHIGCPNKAEFNGTHFCYTCGELLYGRYHNEEYDGTRHFPGGVYKDCRKVKKNVSQRCIIM